MNSRELREKRAKAVADARAVLAKAEKENRGLTDDERQEYDRAWKSVTDLKDQIDRTERVEAEERDGARSVREDVTGGDLGGGSGTIGGTDPDPDDEVGIVENLDPETQARRRVFTTKEYRAAWRQFLRRGGVSEIKAELRALAADVDVTGGYMVAPQQFVNRLIQAVDDLVFIRGMATKVTVTNAQSLGVPSLDTDPADSDWTSELGTGNEDSAMAFGKRELNPHPLAKRIKISNKLLRLASDVESLVRARLAYKFAISQEKAYMTGTGAEQPLGVFTASTNGISTARDVAMASTTAGLATAAAQSLAADGLKTVKFTLKGNYWPRAAWIIHRNNVAVIAKLKDAQNRYLWSDSMQTNEPDRLLGFPVYMSEYSPSTWANGAYAGILGDFSQYWIADALDVQFQRLLELYAASNQTGFIARMETDGMPVLAEAFVRFSPTT
jgi:HK97 family phage major capsid protein